mmetsp:Transcript_32177/g.72281  ORF Transcript_32177/g.72281 Transcript_32177/m.72281 type:complete len:217 (-) Transcript_32177:60-710(-)
MIDLGVTLHRRLGRDFDRRFGRSSLKSPTSVPLPPRPPPFSLDWSIFPRCCSRTAKGLRRVHTSRLLLRRITAPAFGAGGRLTFFMRFHPVLHLIHTFWIMAMRPCPALPEMVGVEARTLVAAETEAAHKKIVVDAFVPRQDSSCRFCLVKIILDVLDQVPTIRALPHPRIPDLRGFHILSWAWNGNVVSDRLGQGIVLPRRHRQVRGDIDLHKRN